MVSPESSSELPVGRDVTYDVPGGALHALVFGDGPRVVLAVHGITASAMTWLHLVEQLPEDWTLVALDLRGRGGSRDLPAPYGLRAHAADVETVARQITQQPGPPVTLLGHSMGAYVAVHAAHERPDLFSRVVLVDGGVALPWPDGLDADEVLASTLGPALARLSRTYPSVEAYVDFFRAHPAFVGHWDDAVEAYVRYDALETADGVRSKAVEDVVRIDGRDLLTQSGEFDPELRETDLPFVVLVAPAGLLGEPPGMLPADAVAAIDDVDHVRIEHVPDVNHYTILLEPAGAARVAAAITA